MPAPKDPIKKDEWKQNISKSNTGHNVSEGTKQKIGLKHKGKVMSEEARQKISLANKGNPSWNKGNHATYEERYGKEKAERILEKKRQIKQSIETINKRIEKVRGQKRTKEELKMMSENRLEFHKKHPEWSKNFSATIKGKTYEERYGMETAQKLRAKIRERETRHLRDMNNQREGKTYEEIYGLEKAKQLMGENHHFWKGGMSWEPYTIDFNRKFKEMIRARDNYCCVICNKPQEELKYKLHIHHVDYNKKNSLPQNCVSLCRIHHIDTNFNRQQWKIFFQSILKERYSYEYTEDQKIILDFTR